MYSWVAGTPGGLHTVRAEAGVYEAIAEVRIRTDEDHHEEEDQEVHRGVEAAAVDPEDAERGHGGAEIRAWCYRKSRPKR